MYAVNELPVRDMTESITGCCPPLNPTDWDSQTFTLDQKPFIMFTTRSFYHIPLNMSSKMRQVMALIDKANAGSPDYLMLSDEVSPWKAEHYIAVTKEVSGAHMTSLSGTYLAKVFEGPYSNMRNWYTELIGYAKSQAKNPIKAYFDYAFCPRCAAAYGHNYVIGFVQIS